MSYPLLVVSSYSCYRDSPISYLAEDLWSKHQHQWYHWSKGGWREWPGQTRGKSTCGRMRAISGSVKPRWAWRSTTQISKQLLRRSEPALNTIILCFQQQGWHPVLAELGLVLVGSGSPTEQEAEPAGPILAGEEGPCHRDPLNPSEPEAEKKPAAPVRRWVYTSR